MTTTVWPGATLVTTDGEAVVEGVVEDGGGGGGVDAGDVAAAVVDDEPTLELALELESLPLKFGTVASVPER